MESKVSKLFEGLHQNYLDLAVLDLVKKQELLRKLKTQFLSAFRLSPVFFIGQEEALPKTPPVDRAFIKLPFKQSIFEFRVDMSSSIYEGFKDANLELFLICDEVTSADQDQISVKILEYWEFPPNSGLASKTGGISIGWNGCTTIIGFNAEDDFIVSNVLNADLASDWEVSKRYMEECGVAFNQRHCKALYTTLAMMACKNIVQERVPPPKKLQEARSKKGKLPLLEYRVLKLNIPETIKAEGIEYDLTSKPHASPRFHLRRGHIRRHPKKLIWVSPCTVGNKKLGEVVKDYRLIFE